MSDDGSEAHEPLSAVGEHFPASWEATPTWTQPYGSWFGPTDAASYSAVPDEVEILRAENAALRSEVGGLRLRIAAMELSYRAALADRATPARVVSPLHRALAVRPGAFGLHTGLEG